MSVIHASHIKVILICYLTRVILICETIALEPALDHRSISPTCTVCIKSRMRIVHEEINNSTFTTNRCDDTTYVATISTISITIG